MFKNRRFKFLLPILAIMWISVTIAPELITQSALYISSKSTIGIIFQNNLSHNTCRYHFIFEERSYEGLGVACGRDAKDTQIEIYFLPVLPNISSNLPPGSNLIVNFSVAFGIFIIAWFSIFFIPRHE